MVKPIPKPKKRKKPKRSTLTNKADRLWSLRVRSKGYCEGAYDAFSDRPSANGLKCAGALQGAHIIGRRYRSTRWDPENGLSLCQGHHTFWTHRPEGFVLWVQMNWPGRYEALWARAQVQWHGNLEDEISTLLDAQDAPR